MGTITEFLSMFGEAGLVFTLMGTAIYILAKEYKKKDVQAKDTQVAFTKHLVETQSQQVETMTSMTGVLDNIEKKLGTIENKL